MSLHQAGQKGGKVIGVVMDVVGRFRRGGDVNGPHPQGVGHGKVAGIILEHGTAGGVKAVLAEDRGEGLGVRLGVKSGMLDAVDAIEKPGKSARRKDFFGIGGAAVGVDDLAAGKVGYVIREAWVGREDREVDVVDIRQVGAGVDVMFAHQAGQRRAICAPVIGAQVVRPGAVDLQCLHNPVCHPDLDLVEKPHVGRVQRVIQVEDPGADVAKILFWHGRDVGQGSGVGKG